MNLITITYYKSPVGELIIGSIEDKLCLCDWRYRRMRTTIDTRIQKGLDAVYLEGTSDVIEQAIAQLEAYFAKERKQFELPIQFVGTEFQQRIWNSLLEIPYGQTKSYLQLTQGLGDEKAIRAVASANGANAISIIVPCHRIIGSDNKLVGYAGGLLAKKRLLELEGAIKNQQLSLF